MRGAKAGKGSTRLRSAALSTINSSSVALILLFLIP